MSASPHLALITSLRSDPELLSSTDNEPQSQLYMLSLHLDRIIAAAHAFRWPNASTLLTTASLEKAIQTHLRSAHGEKGHNGPSKIRVLLTIDGNIDITSSSVPLAPLTYLFPTALPATPITEPSWSVHVFSKPVEPSLYTTHKTTQRIIYDDARKSLPPAKVTRYKPLPQEILLMNTSREIMEGSLTTPYFFRRGKWVTPTASCGGNLGTTRRWALEHDLCNEGLIKNEDLREGEVIWLSNGVRGWGWGKLDMQD